MITIALELEQQQREENARAAIEAQIERETDYFHVGKFDGLIGCEPTQVEEQSYWEGYRQYWAKKLGIEIATEF